jgi:GNAT superfamily N-acetyltransferase
MYILNQLNPADLTPKEKQQLQPLTTEKFASLLNTPISQEEEEGLLFSASLENRPVALLVCSYNRVMKNAQIHTIFVSAPHRNKKIAQGLLKELDKELTKRHCHLTTKQYDAASATKTYLERALGRSGWQGTKLISKRFWFEHEFFSPEWMHRKYRLPPNVHLFPWVELENTERIVLWNSWKSWNIPAVASPFWEEELIVKEGSFGIRNPKGVIGWMITHQETPEIRRYSTFYVHPEYRNTTVAIKILVDAIQYGIDQHVKWGVFDLNIQNSDQSWMKFVDKRLMPYAHHVDQTRQAWHLR